MKKSVILTSNENALINVGTKQMQNCEKLLGIKINSKLTFKNHIVRIYRKSQCQIKYFDQSAGLNESS